MLSLAAAADSDPDREWPSDETSEQHLDSKMDHTLAPDLEENGIIMLYIIYTLQF